MDVLWSPKGGTGASVVAAARAVATDDSLLFDNGGDQAAILGLANPPLGWNDVAPQTGSSSHEPLAAIVIDVPTRRGSCSLAPRGATESWPVDHDAAVLSWLTAADADGRRVVVDGGLLAPCSYGAATRLTIGAIEAGARSFAVVRPCYLALRRLTLVSAHVRLDAVVVVREAGRALDERDVEAAVGVGVVACIDVDPVVARCVDAGILARRAPRALERAVAGAW